MILKVVRGGGWEVVGSRAGRSGPEILNHQESSVLL